MARRQGVKGPRPARMPTPDGAWNAALLTGRWRSTPQVRPRAYSPTAARDACQPPRAANPEVGPGGALPRVGRRRGHDIAHLHPRIVRPGICHTLVVIENREQAARIADAPEFAMDKLAHPWRRDRHGIAPVVEEQPWHRRPAHQGRVPPQAAPFRCSRRPPHRRQQRAVDEQAVAIARCLGRPASAAPARSLPSCSVANRLHSPRRIFAAHCRGRGGPRCADDLQDEGT